MEGAQDQGRGSPQECQCCLRADLWCAQVDDATWHDGVPEENGRCNGSEGFGKTRKTKVTFWMRYTSFFLGCNGWIKDIFLGGFWENKSFAGSDF
ncbi:hypothetical protein A7L51_19095 [Acinetobacter baumannii]|nr:hypothetical protein A7L51_19095 [Acinetobacter baumannii]